ncbi:hypothetical protein [Croceivirga sp. JEA036]|uniref:hypothetical protein n=1 Tax=Croceivirga sp. JEA036 TaxID=2721162 RepID=UPI00143B6F1D|nr:hypothetical protein [Croceivirga sp. JEA036]NJB36368.1 hypothetical protein [Croceivirga sp. JEA036]
MTYNEKQSWLQNYELQLIAFMANNAHVLPVAKTKKIIRELAKLQQQIKAIEALPDWIKEFTLDQTALHLPSALNTELGKVNKTKKLEHTWQ